MKSELMLIITIAFCLTGCEYKHQLHPSGIDGKQVGNAPDSWYYADWNRHRYIITRNAYGYGGIHDPDCPYCMRRKDSVNLGHSSGK